MANIDINEDKTLSAEELEQVKGGLLLPAVQKIREAAARSTTAGSGSGGGAGKATFNDIH
jgi:bacteriocin-like protein